MAAYDEGVLKVDADATRRRLGAHRRARVEDLPKSVFQLGPFSGRIRGCAGVREAQSLTRPVSSRWTPAKWWTEGLDVGGAHECHA